MRVHPSEIYLSQFYHQIGIPFLFCPTTLKELGLNQVDLSRVKENRIELTEVKSSVLGYQVWLKKFKRLSYRTRRLRQILSFTSLNQEIWFNCVIVGAKKESFAKKSKHI